MIDQELQTAFETCTLPRDLWTHRAHVRMAFLYSRQNSFASALDHIRRSINAYNAATQTPDALSTGYHETITIAFMRLINAALSQTRTYTDSNDFCDRHPELLDRSVLKKFYSRDRLMSGIARQTFIEPDLAELP